jgi:hypothetical protein
LFPLELQLLGASKASGCCLSSHHISVKVGQKCADHMLTVFQRNRQVLQLTPTAHK